MSIPRRVRPHLVTVVRYRDSGTEDRFGNPERVEAGREDVWGRLELDTSDENVAAGAVSDRWLLMLEPSVSIGAGDEVLYESRQFDVDGTPDVVRAADAPHHLEVRLRFTGPVVLAPAGSP